MTNKIAIASLRAGTMYFGVFIAGFVTMALEMVFGRSFTPYFGGTIFTWGALISVLLVGMALGYALGGRVADKLPSEKLIPILFCLSSIPIVLFPIVGDWVINFIIDHVEDIRYSALTTAAVLASAPVALLAAVNPLCLRLLLESTNKSGSISGRISALSTIGCIVGTLGTSFYLIPSMGVRSIFFLLAGTSFVAGGVIMLLLAHHTKAKLAAS